MSDVLMSLLEVFAIIIISLGAFGGIVAIGLAFVNMILEFAENLAIEREERKTNPKEYRDGGIPTNDVGDC